MTRRGPSHLGPYGLACTNCFKSKSKCVARPGAEGEACQRCHRLSKQCRPSDSIRRRAYGKKQNSSARIAELESKLDGLISELRSRDALGAGIDRDYDGNATPLLRRSQDSGLLTSPELVTATTTRFADEEDGYGRILLVNDDQECRGCDLSPMSPVLSDPRPDANDDLLSKFRSSMLPYFAFIHLPAKVTAQKLRNDRPFLFHAIVCVALPSATDKDKVTRGRELKRSICEAMLRLEDEDRTSLNRIDLLLGLLVYLAWGWDLHVFCYSSMSRLMMQAMTLAGEMRLGPSNSEGARMMEPAASLFENENDHQFGGTGGMTPTPTPATQDFLEKQRAVLGCFALSSAVSAYFGHVDALRWTMQMEQDLAAVSINKSCPTDEVFAMQVRLQLLAEKGVQILRQQETDQGQVVTTETAIIPSLISLAALKSQLQELQASLSPHLSHRALVVAHAYSAELSLNEVTHAMTSTIPVMVRQFSRMIDAGSRHSSIVDGTTKTMTARRERSLCLWQCAQSSKACASTLVDLSPSEFAGISFVQWVQIVLSLAALNHLTNTIDDSNWDRHAARAHVNMPELLDRLVNRLHQVAQICGEQGPDTTFTGLAHKIHEFSSSVMGSHARNLRKQGEADAAWERSKANAGGRGASPVNIVGLDST